MVIGVFDSGIGGRLIAQKIQKEIPGLKIIFKSDHKYFPYGNKTASVIFERVSQFVNEFQKQGCRIVVIACNTATTNSIEGLRKKFPDIQFVGVEPPVKPIVSLTKTGKTVIIGTTATIKSLRLKKLIEQYAGRSTVLLSACPGLAEYIESREVFDNSYSSALLRKFLDKPISSGVDVVGIACTHYSYLLAEMKKLYQHVLFYDPADAVVLRVQELAGRL